MTISRAFPRAADAMAALFLTAALFQAAPARADVVFDFSGECSQGCSGTATGVLTLADSYTFGSEIADADFISFQYSSSNLSYDITSADSPFLEGGLNADGSFSNSDQQVSVIASTNLRLFESAPGVFVTEVAFGATDVGSSANFTLVSGAVPEPSTWAMILLGFAGLGLAGYRKVKQAAVARS